MPDINALPQAEFGFPGRQRDQLVAAILAGRKTSSACLLAEFNGSPDGLPHAGERSVLIDSADRQVAILATTGVEVLRMIDVDDSHARSEGEGYTNASGWRAAHERFWSSPQMSEELPEGFRLGNDTMVVLEQFKVIERLDTPVFSIVTSDDYRELHSLWLSCSGMGLNDLDDSREGITRLLGRNPATCFAARNSVGQMAGAILAGNDGRRGFIYHLAVREDCRRQGIGSQLVDATLQALQRIGITKVALVVFARNGGANAFWERQGFTTRSDIIYRNKALVTLTRHDT